jgi:AraC-like DNA-binding protein
MGAQSLSVLRMQTIDVEYFSTLIGQDRATQLIARAGLLLADGALPPELELPTFWRLCAENIQASNDESHGIAAEPVPRGSLSVLFTSAKEADTLGDALERFADSARLIRKECQVVLGRSRQAFHLTVRPTGPVDERAEIYVECFTVVAHCALRWMTGRRLDPVMVRGSARLKQATGTLLGLLHAPVLRRGEGVTILYGRDDVNALILPRRYGAWGDQEFESFLSLINEHDETNDSSHRRTASHAVRRHLLAGLRTQEAVSDAMHVSVATLRRRLNDEGCTFRRLSSELRREQLQGLLATGAAIDDVAEKLGLSDARSLRRFCQDSLGVSPRRYRELLRETKP